MVAKDIVLLREIWGSIPGPVKTNSVRLRFDTAATFLHSCVARHFASAKIDPLHHYTHPPNVVSIMKVLFLSFLNDLR